MATSPEHNSAKISTWLRELRAPFFTAVVLPVFLGAIIAWQEFNVFNPVFFILSLLAAIFVNAGTNLANDYFDYKSGCDLAEFNFVSPFSGGSGLLPSGLLNPRQVYYASLLFFTFATIIGIILAIATGPVILILGVIGALSGYFYTTQLAPRGVGEIVVGINCGPLVTLGSFYAQAETITFAPLIASIPLGMLILGVLWINEIPDCASDTKAGKTTLVTRIGTRKAAEVYRVLMLLTYVVIGLGVASTLMPVTTLIALVTIPMAAKTISTATKHYVDPVKLLPANAGTVILHLSIGVLLCIAYLINTLTTSL